MPGDEPVGRKEFDGYILRHEHDSYAHAAMRHDLRDDLVSQIMINSVALSKLRDWQQRIIGGMMFAALLIGGGGLAIVVELARAH